MPTSTQKKSLIPIERIAHCIYLIRGEKVMLDRDLALLYGVKAIALRQQVKRNNDRFPADFMFQLNDGEVDALVSQNVIPSRKVLGGTLPYAFTQEGVAMLSSVLRSKQAVLVNVNIMRTFVRMREILATNKDLAQKVHRHDKDIAKLYDYLNQLMTPPKTSRKRQIGYLSHDSGK
jgi:phage regulator Rha-like protein